MVVPIWLIVLFTGLLGLLVLWLASQHPQVRDLRDERDALREQAQAQAEEMTSLREERAGLQAHLEGERNAAAEKLALLAATGEQLKQQFQALAAEALKGNNQSFLELATANLAKFQEQAKGDLVLREKAVEGLVQPIRESLQKMSSHIDAVEKSRREDYGNLNAQLLAAASETGKLTTETGRLVQALRAPQVGGMWGEEQLRRVVEFAGMLQHCDFDVQASVKSDHGSLRPDMIVRLPHGKIVVVDAKAPMQAYLDTINETDDAARKAKLQTHARNVRDHIAALSGKEYMDQFPTAPDFVIMFMPGETLIRVAFEQDPNLLENAIQSKVLLASPLTLVAMLKTVAWGWQQESIAQNAQAIAQRGRELYDRLCTMAGHFDDMRKGLIRAIEAYNKGIGSMESRVLVTARGFENLSHDDEGKLLELQSVNELPRLTSAQELQIEEEGV